jgi:hypothetical protein
MTITITSKNVLWPAWDHNKFNGNKKGKSDIFDKGLRMRMVVEIVAHFRYIKYSATFWGCEAVKRER